MPGMICLMVRAFLEKRTEGRVHLVPSEKIKLIMKGIDPDQFTPSSPDDPIIIGRLRKIAQQMSIEL